MSSGSPSSESQSNVQVSKLVVDAIKRLKKKRGSSVVSILQYITRNMHQNIDAAAVERCLDIAHTPKIFISRTNKKTGVKFYRIQGKAVKFKNTDNNLKKPEEEKAAAAENAESQEAPVKNGNVICDICKVPVSVKNMQVHERGRRHLNLLNKKRNKQQKKLTNSSSSDELLEPINTLDKPSTNLSTDFPNSNNPEARQDVIEMNRTRNDYRNNHSTSVLSNNDFSNHRPSDKNETFANLSGITSSDLPYSNSPEDRPDVTRQDINRKRSDYRNYSSPNNYFTNKREPYFNNQNYGNRNSSWNDWHPNKSFRNGPHHRFQSFNGYYRYDQEYQFNHPNLMQNQIRPPMYDNWTKVRNLENNFFSENIQSESFHPNEGNINFEEHSNNKDCDKITKTCKEQKSPCRKSSKLLYKNSGIPIKAITKRTASADDDQNQSGSEKQQEKSKVMSDNVTGKRLAHWINPSNHKDKAEIRRLVTEFSKSRKKENLIKLKLHTDKVTVNSDGNQGVNEEISNLESLPSTPEVPESENSAHSSSETIMNVFSSSLVSDSAEANKRQRSRSFTDVASDLPITLSPSARNRSESLTLDQSSKRPQRHRTKRIASNSSIRSCESPSVRKRKDSTEPGSNSKKHKCSSAECLEKCIESAISNTDAFPQLERAESTNTALLPMNAVPEDSLQNTGVYIKKEIDYMDPAQMTSLNELIQTQTETISNSLDDGTMTPVESLIDLFASGNIAIKKEFDDPLIDAIRVIDPVLLNKVCENQPEMNELSQETYKKVIEPVVASPAVVSDTSVTPAGNGPSLTLSLRNILSELQIISTEEERVKESLQNAGEQIQHYQLLLEQWKTKKIKFESEEEILRNKRNTLVRTMNDLLVQQSSECRSTTESPIPGETSLPGPVQNTNSISNSTDFIKSENENEILENIHTESDSTPLLQQDAATEKSVKDDSEDDIILVESDDVVILPMPKNPVTIIDLDHVGSPDKSNHAKIFRKKTPNNDSISANCHKFKDLVAHNAVINSIQIFEDYLYTCASDKMAKRFSLKDPTQINTYSHAEKNISQMCVEKMRGKTYVFTCSTNSKIITVFDAESAFKVKVYEFGPNVASMCKSRGKIYVGLRSGSIVTCDWKDHKELVNIGEAIRYIATTQQGGINVLVTLSAKGHVSVRDADNNGLLIKYVKAITHIPLFMTIYSDLVYLSSAGYLSVLDLSSGNFVKKYELPAAYTSLTVYKDHIFTTSFSGYVRCYSKFDIQDVKAYYGAGKMALTCIHIHDGWVFTGNRTGEISVFKFDSVSSLPCQFGTCQMVFGQKEDLGYHVLQGKDHNLLSLRTCPWRKCTAVIKKNWDQEAVSKHICKHLTALSSHQQDQLYNLAF